MSDLEAKFILDFLAHQLGIEGASLFATLAIVSLVARLIGKAIPDDAIGWKSWVRKAGKIVGLYVSNRITSDVTVTDVAKHVENQVQTPLEK